MAADARGLPILAICRGMQVLNVARGGTLHQHLPDVVGDAICHRQSEPGSVVTHWVTLERASRLGQILGRGRAKVNSFHHQAVAELGADLAITGRASDGTVESLEATDREFVVGVQWHAECLSDRDTHLAVFEAFVNSALWEKPVGPAGGSGGVVFGDGAGPPSDRYITPSRLVRVESVRALHGGDRGRGDAGRSQRLVAGPTDRRCPARAVGRARSARDGRDARLGDRAHDHAAPERRGGCGRGRRPALRAGWGTGRLRAEGSQRRHPPLRGVD